MALDSLITGSVANVKHLTTEVVRAKPHLMHFDATIDISRNDWEGMARQFRHYMRKKNEHAIANTACELTLMDSDAPERLGMTDNDRVIVGEAIKKEASRCGAATALWSWSIWLAGHHFVPDMPVVLEGVKASSREQWQSWLDGRRDTGKWDEVAGMLLVARTIDPSRLSPPYIREIWPMLQRHLASPDLPDMSVGVRADMAASMHMLPEFGELALSATEQQQMREALESARANRQWYSFCPLAVHLHILSHRHAEIRGGRLHLSNIPQGTSLPIRPLPEVRRAFASLNLHA